MTMTSDVLLREVTEADLPTFFDQQLDATANRMAAFTAADPTDRDAFAAHWARILADHGVTIRTILSGGHVAGHIASFARSGKLEVTYWIGREYWGQGIATRALRAFLVDVDTRPIYARVAQDNIASIRVLEKCGFQVAGEDRGFSSARGEEVEEFILQLRATDEQAHGS
jgi:RimJ/RimL family protein N-acetyltransferase